MVVDPLADDVDQNDKSVYVYTWNNPIKYNDPDGKFPTFVVGAIVGAAVEYGTQVATNAYKSGGLSSDSFTKNINYSSILLAGLEGGVTQGASVGRKLFAKAAVTVANNIVEVKTDDNGVLSSKIEGNTKNIVKNSVIDAAADFTTGGLVKPGVSGVTGNILKKSFGESGNKLARGVKAKIKAEGTKITRGVNNSIKKTSKNLVDKTPEKIGNAAETYIKVKTSPTKDEIKDTTNW